MTLTSSQTDFDGLLHFFLAYRNERGLMMWQVRMHGHSGELYVEDDATDCATDGGTCLGSCQTLTLPRPCFWRSATGHMARRPSLLVPTDMRLLP